MSQLSSSSSVCLTRLWKPAWFLMSALVQVCKTAGIKKNSLEVKYVSSSIRREKRTVHRDEQLLFRFDLSPAKDWFTVYSLHLATRWSEYESEYSEIAAEIWDIQNLSIDSTFHCFSHCARQSFLLKTKSSVTFLTIFAPLFPICFAVTKLFLTHFCQVDRNFDGNFRNRLF